MKPIDVNNTQQGKMSALNWKNTHYNLIVGPHHMLSPVGSLKFQESNQLYNDWSGSQGGEERNQVRKEFSPEVQGARERNLDREADPEGPKGEPEGQFTSQKQSCSSLSAQNTNVK